MLEAGSSVLTGETLGASFDIKQQQESSLTLTNDLGYLAY